MSALQMDSQYFNPAIQILRNLRWGMLSAKLMTDFFNAAGLTEIPQANDEKNNLVGFAIKWLDCKSKNASFEIAFSNPDFDAMQGTLSKIQKVALHAYNQALLAAQGR